jgi:large subunit ribosomal protein L13e
MKHNNAVPNAHFHKNWQRRIRTWFDQPARKQRRRNARLAKAKAVFPRPVTGLLRPIVHCPTQRYNFKVRPGRGFTLAELKECKVSTKVARTIGIAVDSRRHNKSDISFKTNVDRLKQYLAKLVLFPKHAIAPKKAKAAQAAAPAVAPVANGKILATTLPVKFATAEQIKAAKQVKYAVAIPSSLKKPETMLITEELKRTEAFRTLRKARADQRLLSFRKRRAHAKLHAKKDKKD